MSSSSAPRFSATGGARLSKSGRTKSSTSDKSALEAVPGGAIREIIPKKGFLHCEDSLHFVLCKPKLLPLKSYTFEKLEKIQQDSVERAKQEMNAASLD